MVKAKAVIFSLALILAISSCSANAIRTVSFSSPSGWDLHGEYLRGSIQSGVLLAHGFGSDQVALQALRREAGRLGFHVFSFDFSGHGRSGGYIGFDNA